MGRYTLHALLGLRAISTTAGKILSLFGSRADAATPAAKACATALGLALIVLEHEQAVVSKNELFAQELFIR